MKYSPKALLDKEPVAIADVVRQGFAFLLVFGVIKWSPAQIGGCIVFLSGLLTLFVRAKSTPTANLEELDKATAAEVAKARDDATFPGDNNFESGNVALKVPAKKAPAKKAAARKRR